MKYKPPASAVANAKKGLKLRKQYGRGGLSPAEAKSQGIDSGVTRARKIASGKVSEHDVRRMSAFNRHRQNYRPEKKMPDGGPTAGTIAWLLWGGTSGVNWAKQKSAAMGAESFEAESDEATLKKYEKTYGKEGAKVRLRLKNKIMKQNTMGTKSGQWSARKSQKLNKEYEEEMRKKGKRPYKSSKRTKSQKDLKAWGDQKWRTKSGKKSSVTGERYLPAKAIKALTDKEYEKTTAAKRKAKKAGKQFSKQPKAIAKKVAKYRAEYKKGTQGPCWDGYTYVGPKPYSSGSCVKNAESFYPDDSQLRLRINTLRGGVENFEEDIKNLAEGDNMKFFLEGVIHAFQTSITGLNNVGIQVTLEEITMNFLPKAEERAFLMEQEGYTEREHYFMGQVWGYDEVMDFISPYQSDFQREYGAEFNSLTKDMENDTLTKKERKMVFLYPLIVGFIGGTIANIASNYLTVKYLKHREII